MNRFKYNFILKPLFLIWDISGFYWSFVIAYQLRFQELNLNIFSNVTPYNFIPYISIISWILLSLILDMQHVPHRKNNQQIFKYFYYPQIIFCFLILLFIVLNNYDDLSRLFIIYFLLLQFIFLLISRVIRKGLVQILRIRGHNKVKLTFFGTSLDSNNILNWIKTNPWSGISYYHINYKKDSFSFDDYFEKIKILKVGDYLIIDKNYIEDENIISKIRLIAENKGIVLFEKFYGDKVLFSDKSNLVRFGPFWVYKQNIHPLKYPINQINKRIFDFLFSFSFLVLIYWWLHIIISILIKLSSKGPIFYRQERVGRYGKIFNCIKYRTMNTNSHINSGITQKNDPRIYTFGSFLRKTNLDEIPQFINVLLGEMSIVGPRPHMIKEDDMLAQELNKYRIRHWVRPGITGLAAVNGYRGGTEDMELMQKRINFDIEYIEHWSLLSDIKISFRTFGAMLLRNNIGH